MEERKIILLTTFTLFLHYLLSAAEKIQVKAGVLFISLVICFIYSACATNYTMQSAEVLNKNEYAIGVFCSSTTREILDYTTFNGLEEYNKGSEDYNKYHDEFNDASGDERLGDGPLMFFRYGIGYNTDIGIVMACLFYNVRVDVKHQFVSYSNLCLSSGIGLEYHELPDLIYNDPSQKYIDLILPVYLSYDLSKFFAVYSAYAYKHVKHFKDQSSCNSFESEDSWDYGNITGGVMVNIPAGNIIITPMAEMVYIDSYDKDISGFQFNAGIMIRRSVD